MRVHVTQADIDRANARRGKPEFMLSKHCPIAQALTRETGKESSVDGIHFALLNSHRMFGADVRLPEEAINFAAKWDNRQRVQPFDFEV